MKSLTILTCLFLFIFFKSSAVGLDRKAMATNTSYSKLIAINNLNALPIGLDADHI